MAQKQAAAAEPEAVPEEATPEAAEPLQVMSRSYYAVHVKEQLMEQPPTYLVVQGSQVIGEFETEAEAEAYRVQAEAPTEAEPEAAQ